MTHPACHTCKLVPAGILCKVASCTSYHACFSLVHRQDQLHPYPQVVEYVMKVPTISVQEIVSILCDAHHGQQVQTPVVSHM